MEKQIDRKAIIQIVIMIGLFICAYQINKKFQQPTFKISSQDKRITISNTFYDWLHMGNKRLITGLLWIKTLLDSDLEHYRQRDLNNWMFLRFKTMIDLDPKFLMAYQLGGLYLSVIKDDIPGASYIYKKGIEQYPDDYGLCLNGGIHFFTEEREYDLAYDLLNRIIYHESAPFYLPSLLARIKRAETNDPELSLQLLYAAYKNAPEDSKIKQKFHQDIYSLLAELDLACLNAQNENCRTKDFNGNPYFFQDGQWQAKEQWKKFELHRHKIIPQ